MPRLQMNEYSIVFPRKRCVGKRLRCRHFQAGIRPRNTMTSAWIQKWAVVVMNSPVDRLPHARGVATVFCGTRYLVQQGSVEQFTAICGAYAIRPPVFCAPQILMHTSLRIHCAMHDTNIGNNAAQPPQKLISKKLTCSKNGNPQNVCTLQNPSPTLLYTVHIACLFTYAGTYTG